MKIIEEKQNQYAYQLMCFMDIFNGYPYNGYLRLWQDKLGLYYQNKVIESSEELFECLGLFINFCNDNDKDPNISRYEYWENCIENFLAWSHKAEHYKKGVKNENC